MAQEARVPSFPLREAAEQLASAQLAHRGFWRESRSAAMRVKAPGPPFGMSFTAERPLPHRRVEAGPDRRTHLPLAGRREGSESGAEAVAPLPLSGIRVLDFSWVIAGPTATRYLAAMGAEIIKIEAPGRGDPGRASELHTVLGQGKRGIVLDLKKPEAIDVARRLAARFDVLVENFATGVMDRLGLGADALREVNPGLIYVSASGLGRTGPEARAVAYGTLLQCYSGFAGLNRHPEIPPRVGMAWLDPMCGLMLAFVTAAALWRRARSGPEAVARIDFSMLEAMLWTMAEPLLDAQLGDGPHPVGNRSERHAPHGVYRCAGDDDWIAHRRQRRRAVAGALRVGAGAGPACRARAGRTRASGGARSTRRSLVWARPRRAEAAAAELIRAGVPAAALATSRDLVDSPHLRARGFWEEHGDGVLPGLPWRASFGRASGTGARLSAPTPTRCCAMCSGWGRTKSRHCGTPAPLAEPRSDPLARGFGKRSPHSCRIRPICNRVSGRRPAGSVLFLPVAGGLYGAARSGGPRRRWTICVTSAITAPHTMTRV